MGDNTWDLDLDDDEFSNRNPLRDPLKAAQKRIKELEKEFNSVKEENGKLVQGARQRTVEEVLSSKGVRKSIAKYIPADVEGDDAVNAWLVENAEDFGIDLVGEGTAGMSAEDLAASQLVSAATSGAAPVPDKVASIMARMSAANTKEEYEAVKAEGIALGL